MPTSFIGFIIMTTSVEEMMTSTKYDQLYKKLQFKYGALDLIHSVDPWVCCGDPYSNLVVGINIEGMSFEEINKLNINKIKEIRDKYAPCKKIAILST